MPHLPRFHLLVLLLLGIGLRGQQFVDERVVGGFVLPVGFAIFDRGTDHGAHTIYVWERSGRVRVVEDGLRLPGDLIDLREEVGNWRDFGLLGMALDPGFATNGYYYLAYVVDRHHLLHYGTPAYDPAVNEYFDATIVRVTRFTADVANEYRTTVPGSRHVLLGESPSAGVPITGNSHGACAITFGADGTLLVATGDGAVADFDTGSFPVSKFQQALSDGILRPEENVGAFRAQMLGSLNGKILRLDPATGDGLPSNPFFDPANPRSPRSRVFALGLRNPCRIALEPGTGSADPGLGRPGTLFVGDVGWGLREECNLVATPGQNFGWPIYEGMEPSPLATVLVENRDEPNPLAGAGCTFAYFRFQDLLQQAHLSHGAFFPNPCDPLVAIPSTVPTFEHALPVLDWRREVDDARAPVFVGNSPTFPPIGSPPSTVIGQQFRGNASIGGCWHSGLSFPPSYGPCYYQADFGEGWIRRLIFDAQDQLVEVDDFAVVDTPLMLAEDPDSHALWYLSYHGGDLRRISFGIEPPPTAVPAADVRYGAGTLVVQLDGRASFDPQGQPLTYLWDLGFGRTSTAPQLGFKLRGGGGPTQQLVQLTVQDSLGATGTAQLAFGLDNTPPVVRISSFDDGDLYRLDQSTTLPLAADVSDAEHTLSQLRFAWRTTLYHYNHTHPEPLDATPVTTTVLSPTPNDGEFYCYRVDLTVTDPAGLAASARGWLFPDTSGASTSVVLTSPAAGESYALGQPVDFSALTTGTVQRVEYYVEGELVGVASTPPYATSWTPPAAGRFTMVALAVAPDGTCSNTRGKQFVVEATRLTKQRTWSFADDATEDLSLPSSPRLDAPTLTLGADAAPQLLGLSFAGLAVPPGARIRSAHIEFTAAASDASPASLQIALVSSLGPQPIRGDVQDLSSRATGTAIAWSPADWVAGESGAAQRTPDLTALLQPVVSKSKWRQSLLFTIQGTGRRTAWSFDGNASVSPVLCIEWLPPLPTSTTASVAGSSDDAAEVIATGAVSLGGANLVLGENQGAPILTALRFPVALDGSVVLESARLEFTAAGTDLGAAELFISAAASDDAGPITAAAFGLSSRPRTLETATWYPPEWPTPGAGGAAQRSPELRDTVAEVLGRPGWAAGNHIMFFLEGTGSRTACSFDTAAIDAPRLVLRYRPAGLGRK